MNPSEQAIREAAYHEAGHAVLAALLDIPFRDVLIQKRPRRDQGGYIAGRILTRARSAFSLRDIERLTLMMMAGPAVEKRLRRVSWIEVFIGGGAGDFNQAARLLDLVTERYWTYQYLKFVRARAVKAVRIHWDLITKIGDALIERGRLTRAEVLRLIGETRDAEYLRIWYRPMSILRIPSSTNFFLNSRKPCPNLPDPNPWYLDQSQTLLRRLFPKITGLTMEQLERGDPLERKRERRNGHH